MIFTKNKITKKDLVLLFFCLILPVFLLLLSYKVVLFFTNTTPAQEHVFSFLDGKGNLPAGFTESEVSHLQDVQQVIKKGNYVFYVLLLMLTITLSYYKKEMEFIQKLLNYGGKTTLVTVLIILFTSFFFFDTVFTLFHFLFFPQGNWLFPVNSMLIQTFPLDFFVTISRNIFFLTLFWGILFILLIYYLRYVYCNRN